MKNSVKTYQPDNSLKKGYVSIFGEIMDEIASNRWLTYQLFKKDFFATYKQSLGGVFWVFVLPVFSVATFAILNRSGVLRTGDTQSPYVLYAVLGITFWQLFSAGLIASTQSLVEAGSMIKIINFSKKSLVIAASGRSLVAFAIQFVFVGFLFLAYHKNPQPETLLAPLAVMPLWFLTLGLGFILALLNGVMRDIGNALSMVMTFLMFLTPVLYAKPDSGILQKITHYNPLYYLIGAPRDLILHGALSEPKGFFFSALFAAAVFTFCLVTFHLTETRITERV